MAKSPRAVAREALALARDAMPAYSSSTNRRDFTRHQPSPGVQSLVLAELAGGELDVERDRGRVPAEVGHVLRQRRVARG